MLTDLHLETQYLIKLNADGFLLVWECEDIVCLYGQDDRRLAAIWRTPDSLSSSLQGLQLPNNLSNLDHCSMAGTR